jgi:hypothetical protein
MVKSETHFRFVIRGFEGRNLSPLNVPAQNGRFEGFEGKLARTTLSAACAIGVRDSHL